jgi:hypothetical protein
MAEMALGVRDMMTRCVLVYAVWRENDEEQRFEKRSRSRPLGSGEECHKK